MSYRVAIAGSGISGLAAAIWLQKLEPSIAVTLFEQESRPGGKLLTERIDGFVIDAGPDAFLASKPGGLQLSRELGLEPQLITPNPDLRGSFVLRGGALEPLPEGLSGLVPSELRPMFRTRLLSPRGKARMLLDLVLPPRRGDEDESLQAFVSRRLGSELYERMIEPLLAGIYAGDGSLLSLAATFPQLRTAEQTHGGIIKGAVAQKRESQRRLPEQMPRRGFLGFPNGISTLVDAAVQHAQASGAAFHCSSPVMQVERAPSGPGFTIRASGHQESFDGVIVATPAWAAAPLVRGVAPAAADALGEIDHVSSAIAVIGFPASQLTHPLHGYGYVVPRAEHRDLMAMTWVSSKWPGRAPEGQVLLRGFFGRAGQDAILAQDDDGLIEAMLLEMRGVLGLDVTPTLARVYRWDRGMPQYTFGHLDRIARLDAALARVAGIQVAGNMLRGVGIPDSIVSGQQAATNLLSELRAIRPTGS